MSDVSKYPVAAAIMEPTNSPITTLHDFIIGLPNLSQIMIVTKAENPSPTYHQRLDQRGAQQQLDTYR